LIQFTNTKAVLCNPKRQPINSLFASFLRRYPHLVNESVVSIRGLATRLDAMTVAAIALNKTLMKHAYSTALDLDSSPFKTELLKNIRAVDFYGLTGRVKLDQNGDRLANAIAYQIRSFKGVPVALIDTYADKLEWYEDLVFAGESFFIKKELSSMVSKSSLLKS
uniref:ANF_receptor domain-containing protein n=1 Tax=Macrostomum lignano TaxID=282301 RepID=A0A1I8G2F2_9PLAT